jgi:hypothetical protein
VAEEVAGQVEAVLAVAMVEQIQPEQIMAAQLEPECMRGREVAAMAAAHLETQTVEMAALQLAAMAQPGLFALCGPEISVLSHPPIQVICNDSYFRR